MEQPYVPPAPTGGSVDTVHGSVHDGAWAGEARAAAGCAGPLLALPLARGTLAGRRDLDRLARRVERDTADSVFRISGLRRPGPYRRAGRPWPDRGGHLDGTPVVSGYMPMSRALRSSIVSLRTRRRA
ncbi:hypothetical protein MBT42_35210 [Streptomyces sp. MBT42]|uniref:hypothetical protein n=1 Tax=Streptomyces sp. MBT42 TaxID=1488373 RepID=UPI001E64FB64|nr:hypothetical protein [Streptomyces sp. MBT42]MCD2468785.1 hypothetical protein [Streptomyces sp. MBT42]